jgi:hypothetical protein
MRRPGRKQLWRSLLPRRFGTAVALVAYLVTAFGLPLPVFPAHSGKPGAPFPCQNRPCGCQAVGECCQGCCCSHPQEQASAEPDCCAADHGRSRPAENPARARDEPGAAWRWVHGISALRCRGSSTSWVSSGVVSLVPPPLAWTPGVTVVDSIPTYEEIALVLPTAPPTPPPRQPLV